MNAALKSIKALREEAEALLGSKTLPVCITSPDSDDIHVFTLNGKKWIHEQVEEKPNDCLDIQLPAKLVPVFIEKARHRGAFGGRGSGKTHSFALMTAVRGYMFAEAKERGVILCSREHLNSLDDSSLQEVKQAIASNEFLSEYYEVGEKYVRTKNRLISYVFAGLRSNLDSIKSKAKILINWTDEADSVSEIAYRKLMPTIRAKGSENWVTWNPERKESPTDTRYRLKTPKSAVIVEINYTENPWFTEELEQQRQEDQELLDDNTYTWIWEGAYLENSNAQVLHGKVKVNEFEPGKDWHGPYFGVDFGFAQDPTTGVKCWVFDNSLYIEYEGGKVGLELDDTSEYLTSMCPEIEKHVCRADSARPESISYLKRKGLPRMEGVKKWPGSVEDGITHLRSYKEIVIHPRCKETIKESRAYSYKVDKLTEEVLPVIIDKFNHYIDAIRYAVNPLIQRAGELPSVAFKLF